MKERERESPTASSNLDSREMERFFFPFLEKKKGRQRYMAQNKRGGTSE